MERKRHRITDEEVREMLRLKREGKTDTAIAKTLGIIGRRWGANSKEDGMTFSLTKLENRY